MYPWWEAHAPTPQLRAYIKGCYSFGLEEIGQYKEAEETALAARMFISNMLIGCCDWLTFGFSQFVSARRVGSARLRACEGNDR